MSELFIAKTMPEKDWSQVSKPNGWDDVACGRIITDKGLGVYVADVKEMLTGELRSSCLSGLMARYIIHCLRSGQKPPRL